MIILRQKEYARRDYMGLTNSEKEALRKKRAALAKEEFGKYRKAVDSVKKWADFDIANLKEAAGLGLDKDYVNKEILNIKNNAKKDRIDYARIAIQAIDPKKEDLRWEAFENHNAYNAAMGHVGNWKGRTRQILKDIDRENADYKRRMDFLKRVEKYKADKAKTRALVPNNNQVEQAAEKGFKLGKKGKIGLAVVGTSLAGGGAYAGYKYYKNKNKNKKD